MVKANAAAAPIPRMAFRFMVFLPVAFAGRMGARKRRAMAPAVNTRDREEKVCRKFYACRWPLAALHPNGDFGTSRFKTARRKPSRLHWGAEGRSGLLRCGIWTRLMTAVGQKRRIDARTSSRHVRCASDSDRIVTR